MNGFATGDEGIPSHAGDDEYIFPLELFDGMFPGHDLSQQQAR